MSLPSAASTPLRMVAARTFRRVAQIPITISYVRCPASGRAFATCISESVAEDSEQLGPHHVADEKRLARRLRLADGWQLAAPEGIVKSHERLVAGEQLRGNPTHSKAVEALAKLPPALEPCRAARRLWDAEQARLTAIAEKAEERLQKEREEADARSKGLERIKAAVMDRDAAKRLEEAEAAVKRARGDLVKLGPPPKLHPGGVYLHGPVGSGKSTMMDMMCLFGHHGFRLRRQHFHEFSLWLHELLRVGGGVNDGQKPEDESQHILAHIADRAAEGVDILCLDEFAVTNVADAAIFTELFKLLADRYVAVVCTTNRPPEDLYQSGLHRDRHVPALVDHLRGSFIVVLVDGPDYRQEMFRKESVNGANVVGESVQSVTFVGGDMESALRAALEGDVGGMPDLNPGKVKISWGRQINVPLTGDGVACFHFDDLCRKPYGAEDFLCLALRFHTIFVHGIPRLSLEEHNEARRFTNFVDAIYEHSVRLIIHSKVPIDDVLTSVEALREATGDGGHDADRLGVFEPMYDDSPNFQLQIQELGGRDKYKELRDRREAEQLRADAKRLGRLNAPDAAEGDVGSGWSAAPASADLSAPDEGVAGVMVAAVGSLQESGFAARRAVSRLREMRTVTYLEVARQRRETMVGVE